VTSPDAALHRDALRLLRGWRPPDEDQEKVRRRFVDHLEEHPDGLRRACFPAHVTASTLVVSADADHVLLTLHKKAGAWFQLGGHCEPQDATLSSAASREAAEESGVPGLELDPDPVQLDAHEVPFCHPDGTVAHLDVRFVAVAPADAEHAVSEESLDVRWWPVDQVPTQDPGLRDLARLALARLRAHGRS